MYSWLLSNGFMLSKDKTKLTQISSMFCPRPELNSIFVSDELIYASSHISNLGMLFQKRFSFNKHISSSCKVAYYNLTNFAHIRRHLDDFNLETVVHDLVKSCLDYRNYVLYGLPSYQIARLQHVQNAAVSLKYLTIKT